MQLAPRCTRCESYRVGSRSVLLPGIFCNPPFDSPPVLLSLMPPAHVPPGVADDVVGGGASPLTKLLCGRCRMCCWQTLVALTNIFAIQRCDPAPFYLFDEVDANLDAMYRGAVAKMITQQKKAEKDGEGREVGGCQFLTSSFHEELVKAADCHWLVSHTGMSRITRGDVSQQLTIVRKNASTVQGAAPAR